MQHIKSIIKSQSSYNGSSTILRVQNSALGAPCASLRSLTDGPAISHQLIS